METEQTEQKSFRNVIIVLVIIVAFMAVIGVVVYALMVSSNKQGQAPGTAPAPWPRVATKEEVDQNLTNLNNSLKQAKDDQDAANTAIKDNQKQIKVGN